jgi:hypothetical protein
MNFSLIYRNHWIQSIFFRAFCGLNSRINQLIYIHIRADHLDFRSVANHDFDILCRQRLASIVDRIISLRLSDGKRHQINVNHFFFIILLLIDSIICNHCHSILLALLIILFEWNLEDYQWFHQPLNIFLLNMLIVMYVIFVIYSNSHLLFDDFV